MDIESEFKIKFLYIICKYMPCEYLELYFKNNYQLITIIIIHKSGNIYFMQSPVSRL